MKSFYFLLRKKAFSTASLMILSLFFSLLIFELILQSLPYVSKLRMLLKNNNTVSLYAVGGSTSWGEPYAPKISFPKIVSYQFDGKLAGKDIKIINLAESGKDVIQAYWRLFRELSLRPPKNAVLLVYTGINDIVGPPRSASEQRPFFFNRFKSLSYIDYIFRYIFRNPGPEKPLESYQYYLEDIIRLAKKYNVRIVVSTIAGNLSGFEPEFRFSDSEQTRQLIKNSMDSEEKEPAKALSVYKKILEEEKYDPSYIFYRMAKTYEAMRDYEKARILYWRSVEDYDNNRPNLWQEAAIRSLAGKYSIALNDTLRNFEDASPNSILGYELFRDAHHPNITGYIIMSNGFSEKISEMYNQPIIRKDITPKELFRHFKYYKHDFFNSYISSARWFIMKAREANFPESLYGKSLQYLDKAGEYKKDDPEIFFWKLVIALLQDDKKPAEEYYSLIKQEDMEGLIGKANLYPQQESMLRDYIKSRKS